MPDGTTITIEAQSTDFERSGTTTQQVVHIGNSQDIPGIQTVMGREGPITKPAFTPAAVLALSQLAALWGFSPIDLGTGTPTSYSALTAARYNDLWAVARAMAQSGPSNVRGGTARQAFELAELSTLQITNRFKEIWQNEVAWAQVVTASASESNRINRDFERVELSDNEQFIMAEHANAQYSVAFLGQINALNQNIIQQYSAAKHYGTTTMTTSENLTGIGIQNGVVNGFGMSSWR